MEYHLQPIPVVLGSHVQNAFKALYGRDDNVVEVYDDDFIFI